jgi:hypothetical protein
MLPVPPYGDAAVNKGCRLGNLCAAFVRGTESDAHHVGFQLLLMIPRLALVEFFRTTGCREGRRATFRRRLRRSFGGAAGAASLESNFEEIVVVRKISVCCLSVAALLVAGMNSSYAQSEGQGHRHGRHAAWMAHGVNPLAVLRSDAVQQELALNPEQTNRVQELLSQVHEEFSRQIQAAGGGLRGDRKQSSEDRQQHSAETRSKFAEISRRVNEEFRGKLASILNPAQQTRLREIAIQAAGTHAFQDTEVARQLGLTPAQQEQLAAVHREYAEKFGQLRSEGGERHSRDQFAKMHELRQQELSQSIGVLTPAQQQTFAAMTGKPFNFGHHHRGHDRNGNGGPSA